MRSLRVGLALGLSVVALIACGGKADPGAGPPGEKIAGDSGLDGTAEASPLDGAAGMSDPTDASSGGKGGGPAAGGAAGSAGEATGGGGTGTGGTTGVSGSGGSPGTGGTGGTPVSTGPVRAVSAGSQHTCALMATGGVRCWGDNSSGQLGVPSWGSTPLDVVGLNSSATQISSGDSHTCAVLASGGAQCWGQNTYGQLGNGNTKDAVYTPQNVMDLQSGVTQVTAGALYTCALLNSGSVKCWGDNMVGQLGNGTGSFDPFPTPATVEGLASEVSVVSAGSWQTCVLVTGGRTKCWGGMMMGGPITGMVGESYSPVDIPGLESGVSLIASGYDHICALTTAGAVRCWGYNDNGQIGHGTDSRVPSPVEVTGLGTDVVSIEVGGAHTCALMKSGGLKCWGHNANGQIGDGMNSDRYAPVDVVGLGSGVASVSAGFAHTCAVLANSSVKCWGKNEYGQLGDGTTQDSATPVDVVGL